MFFSLTLVDINPRLVAAWREAFADAAEVQVIHGSILQQQADAWVTPTNARGHMNGGLDAVMKRYFGDGVEARVRRDITQRHTGRLPIGRATCVPTCGLYAPGGGPQPRFLISSPTMATSSQDVSRTDNVAWATAAALQAARMQNAIDPGSIRSVALPGLGASTGRVPPQSCAQQMRAAWQIVRDQPFDNFEEMHEALAAHLRDWTPMQVRRVRRKRILGIF